MIVSARTLAGLEVKFADNKASTADKGVLAAIMPAERELAVSMRIPPGGV